MDLKIGKLGTSRKRYCNDDVFRNVTAIRYAKKISLLVRLLRVYEFFVKSNNREVQVAFGLENRRWPSSAS